MFEEGALGTVKHAANSPFLKMVHFIKVNWVTHPFGLFFGSIIALRISVIMHEQPNTTHICLCVYGKGIFFFFVIRLNVFFIYSVYCRDCEP